MSSQFLSLEEAAKKLGITADRMVELRSQGKIRGFKDGASWKFPETEVDRLGDELASDSGEYDPYKGLDDDFADDEVSGPGSAISGSGVLVDESSLGSTGSRKSSGNVIGGDEKHDSESGSGSDVGVGSENLVRSGSDVNLIAGDSNGSDVRIVTSKVAKAGESDDFATEPGLKNLVEIDSSELQLSNEIPVITHDSGLLDLAIEPNAGSTGPITDKELKAVANQNPDLMVGKKAVDKNTPEKKTLEKKASGSGSGLAFDDDEDDSDDDMIGLQSEDDILGSDLDLSLARSAESSGIGLGRSRGVGASSLELMDDLGSSSSTSSLGSRSSRGLDVLSELDLLGADAGGSGLITGDSGNVIGSDVGSGSGRGSKGSGLDFDDALADDDDLVIADDEDDLVLGGGASDVSVSGDSGINLMSPSDSGLSLESEPLDLAGSSISALDLGAELGSDIGGGSGKSSPARSGRRAALNIQKDEDFNLSPSGIGIDADDSSQVIEIEDSSAFADADAFEQADFGSEPAEVGFDEAGYSDGDSFDEQPQADEQGFGVSPSGATSSRARATAAPVYEVPFSIFQVSMLLVTLILMSVGGMLMTDLLRNMWAFTGTEAPVSSLTDALISMAGLDG